MRIWLQSAAALGRDSMWADYEKVLKKHVQAVARPDTTVDLHGVKVMTTGIDRSHYFESLNTAQIINNALKAEKKGYDAFALACMLDPGFFELREVVNIPIAFSLESACYVSCLLAPKFALLAYSDIMLQRLTEYVKHYGLGERLVPSGCFSTTLEALQDGFKDPEPLLKGAREVAKKAAEQGADMLISTCGCLNMIFINHGIREIEGVPVIDSVGTVVKTAEFLVDLKNIGVDRVNRGLYTRVTKEELSAVRKLYKIE